MTAPPQHMIALERGNRIRVQRGALHHQVAALNRADGLARVAGLLMAPPEEIQTMRIYDLLLWVHRIGRSQARGILRSADLYVINEGRRVQDLTGRQRAAIAQFIHGESWGPC